MTRFSVRHASLGSYSCMARLPSQPARENDMTPACDNLKTEVAACLRLSKSEQPDLGL